MLVAAVQSIPLMILSRGDKRDGIMDISLAVWGTPDQIDSLPRPRYGIDQPRVFVEISGHMGR